MQELSLFKSKALWTQLKDILFSGWGISGLYLVVEIFEFIIYFYLLKNLNSLFAFKFPAEGMQHLQTTWNTFFQNIFFWTELFFQQKTPSWIPISYFETLLFFSSTFPFTQHHLFLFSWQTATATANRLFSKRRKAKKASYKYKTSLIPWTSSYWGNREINCYVEKFWVHAVFG